MKYFTGKKFLLSGFTLIEMLIYVSLLAVIFILLINTVLGYTGSYRTLQALRLVEHSGIDSMERMTRDIRAANTVDTNNSTLGSNPGILTIIQSSGATSTTTKYYVQSGTLRVDINGVYSGPLTVSGATVNSLVFTMATSSNSSAVKMDLTISGTSGSVTSTKSFHSTIILKGQ